MGKLLYLIRHAKSDWSVNGQKDFDRELNSRGYNDAPRMGRKLYDLNVKPDIIISSPAARAKLTAELIAEQIKYETDKIIFEEEIYEASVRTLLAVINTIDDQFASAAIFGHNPGLTYLAEYLTKKTIGNIPTCGVVEISFKLDSWKEISGDLGKMNWFIYPKGL